MALGKDAVLMASAAGAIVSANVTVLICAGDPESCTAKAIDEPDTAVAGVPEITPVEAANDSPAGSAPLVMLQE